jgi:methionine synthase II (cobalamin-independent)
MDLDQETSAQTKDLLRTLAVGFQWRASRRGLEVRNLEVSLQATSDNILVFLGIEDPRTAEVEAPEEIVRRVRQVLAVLGPERVFLNPDCGFGTFADRPVATSEVAAGKLAALTAAARILRG